MDYNPAIDNEVFMSVKQSLQKSPISQEVAWKALHNLLERFKLNDTEGQSLMGEMPRSTYYKGLKEHSVKLSRDQLERISYLLGIYKGLRILFTDSNQATSWIDRPNTLPPFNGLTPKAFMLEGSLVRLAEVRRFIDYWRG
jgi:uncharacterized protein (DUF2384 family)